MAVAVDDAGDRRASLKRADLGPAARQGPDRLVWPSATILPARAARADTNRPSPSMVAILPPPQDQVGGECGHDVVLRKVCPDRH